MADTEKLYGIYENKCLKEVVPKTETVVKGDFAVIEDAFPLEANTQSNVNNGIAMATQYYINFPEGFDKDNCVCVACGLKIYGMREDIVDKGYGYGIDDNDGMALTTGGLYKSVFLGTKADNAKILLQVYQMSTEKKQCWFRIVLMKVS